MASDEWRIANGSSTFAVRGYVLAGGASSRFGADKALAKFGEKSLLSRMCAVLQSATGNVAVVAAKGKYTDEKIELIEDCWPDEGPLGGIITALRTSASGRSAVRWNIIVSCDMPFLTREWLEYLRERAALSECDVVVPRSEHGLEPLCACWKTGTADALEKSFSSGTRKVTEAMKCLRMEVLDETHWKRFDSAGRLFWNMNTPRDYDTALRMWELEKS